MPIDPASSVPLWRQIADSIAAQVADGDLAVGDEAPSTRTLSGEFEVSMSTATSAMAELRRRGLVQSYRGRPPRVSRRPQMRRYQFGRYKPDGEVSPATEDYARDDRPVELSGTVTSEYASPRIAHRLAIEPGDPVTRVDYLWVDPNGPVQRSTQWEPLSISKGTSAETPPEDGEPDVIARYAAIGWRVTRVVEDISGRMPTAAEAKELQLGADTPVFRLERTHHAGGTPVETADITIRCDKSVITAEHIVQGGDHA